MAAKRTKPPTLTIKDLLAAAADNEGFGFIGHNARRPETWASFPDPYACTKALDEGVVAAANELGWSAQQLADWVNSKAGRWFADEQVGCELADIDGYFETCALVAMKRHPA